MQKRTAKEYLAAMEKRVKRLRGSGLRSMRGKIIPETLRESHAREFAVRSWILPSFRSGLGSDLKAIILPGSVQLGIRKASKKREKSDIDVSVVVSDKVESIKKGVELAAVAERGLKGLLGVDVNVHVFPAEVFKFKERGGLGHFNYLSYSFQVMYGRNWLVENFGKDFDKSFRFLKELQKKKKKYTKHD